MLFSVKFKISGVTCALSICLLISGNMNPMTCEDLFCNTSQTMFFSIRGLTSCSLILLMCLTCISSFYSCIGLTENFFGSGTAKELLKYHELLRDSIKDLKAVESARATLVACLREALLEQVLCWFILLNALLKFCCLFGKF